MPTPPDRPAAPPSPEPAEHAPRHHRTRAEERIAELDTSPTALLARIEALGAERDAALAKADEHLALAQRAAADYANLRRRTAEEREAALGLANELLLGKVVTLADDFDRAIEHVPDEARATPWLEGIAAIDRKLRTLLESEGVTLIEALGLPFDPHVHEAAAHVPGTGRPENEVVAEIRRGYRLRDRVLRPSLVAVSDGSPAPADRTS
ncbi:MAG: nucleotide exchange factor GrpE [Chloroflexi bacterium]|nr:nucleotide exchange factor GrpE [Chloroflexota bacterium]